MESDLEEYIFTYLDKRYPIKDNIVYFKDSRPEIHIWRMFSVAGLSVIREWVISRVGKTYCKQYPSGAQYWFKNLEYHREDGPAVTFPNAHKEWWLNGELHRDDDLPAVIHNNGRQEWYQHSELHRDGGPARIFDNGTKEWYQNGQLHRDDGPARIYPDDTKEWYQNGRYHRLDGPAVVFPDGEKEWWVNGIPQTKKQFEKKSKTIWKK